jgi:hypothetical protein
MSPVLEAGQNIAKRTLQEVAAHARAASASQVPYIFTHSFTTRFPDPCGYVPNAERDVKLKITLKFLKKID